MNVLTKGADLPPPGPVHRPPAWPNPWHDSCGPASKTVTQVAPKMAWHAARCRFSGELLDDETHWARPPEEKKIGEAHPTDEGMLVALRL